MRFLKGVGPARADALAGLGILTVRDLVHYFPMRHERYGPAVAIEDLQPDQVQTVIAKVLSVKPVGLGRATRVRAALGDNTGRMHCTWFSAPWMVEKLRPGAWVKVRGKMQLYADWPSMTNPETEVVEDPVPTEAGQEQGLLPVYRVCEGVTSKQMAQLAQRAWKAVSPRIEEWYDAPWRQRRSLLPRRLALQRLHWPEDPTQLADARRRLAYDELLLLQLAVAIRRWHIREGRRAPSMPLSEEIDRRIRKRFPFPFTAAQDRAAREISADMARPVAMNRLLEGDVGSGKTAIAVYASLLAIAHRWQVAILAPTEILAEQHYARICQYLAGSKVRHGLLTGATGAKVRRDLLGAAGSGKLDILVGTHALLEENVAFDKLGLVIVDEQHRFGVRQRAIMRGKGYAPHYLVMTATPIPRTLAMTLFGDLDISIVDQMPPGRQPVRTRLVSQADETAAFKFVASRIAEGEQAFVVYPLISESEDLPIRQPPRSSTGSRSSTSLIRPSACCTAGCPRSRSKRLWMPSPPGISRCWSRRRSSRWASTCPAPPSWSSSTPSGTGWRRSTSCGDVSAGGTSPAIACCWLTGRTSRPWSGCGYWRGRTTALRSPRPTCGSAARGS